MVPCSCMQKKQVSMNTGCSGQPVPWCLVSIHCVELYIASFWITYPNTINNENCNQRDCTNLKIQKLALKIRDGLIMILVSILIPIASICKCCDTQTDTLRFSILQLLPPVKGGWFPHVLSISNSQNWLPPVFLCALQNNSIEILWGWKHFFILA